MGRGSSETPHQPYGGSDLNHDSECRKCANLRAGLKRAVRRGNASRVIDYRVLLRRHPQHDGVPVPATETST
ncbi:hypothetical protein EWI31_20425 [Streptomyces tsukubensis]|uniref:Uncharacterized protein n=1 Tax=Streptomyces tsukubensis (strain DSM 42081 / NBRC 108919 / NRRL 18488 / 9993) TaxID=1114943 RepID=A0A7G3UIU7_STRT9|nr:hypothetical protein STSU_021110 [Streptomyces tsukubensis NRRL18488]TAI42773.1 hypothetical protein EWI31_20425 [Streptomyces tsukubensis]